MRMKKNKRVMISVNKRIILSSIVILAFIIVVLPTIIVSIPQNKALPYMATENVSVLNQDTAESPTFEVSIKRSETGEVETVPLEEYVLSVVASEMPIDFAEEALKAQSVAARTYIVQYLLQQNPDAETIITDTTEHQVYKNAAELQLAWGEDYHWKRQKIEQAVEATKGEIITYDEIPITPTFFSMSNGYTENAEDYWGTALPYLKKVESKWEEELPNFTEQTVFTIDEVNQKLGLTLQSSGTVAISITRTSSERVKAVDIDNTTLSGKEVREKLGLRSSDFTITQKNDHLLFTTKGYGHGVGMSQYGANEMALHGSSYDDILFYYYQDVEIKLIGEAAPTLVLHQTKDI